MITKEMAVAILATAILSLHARRHIMKRCELLAPAGDMNCLKAAFNAGADAVYLAGKSFGARAFANNFENIELLEALDYAHIFSKKIYLTMNTLIKESEFANVYEFLKPLYERGLDGIIIQDMGLVSFLKKEFPLLELHGSTQMTVNNYKSALWLKEQGVCRVVPSRELMLEELQEIKEKAHIEVEAFIHGAMCYGYSGQCLFSSFLGGRSGNRGKCAQPCRLPYQVSIQGNSVTKKEIYPLSLKDLCSLPYIYEMLDAGIDSFKIEGRMKSPEYVAGVTSIYRKYMDYYAKGKKTAIAKEDLEQLSHLYIRSEMKDGYLKKHNGKDMISIQSPSYQGCDEALVQKIHAKYCSTDMQLPIIGTLSLYAGSPAVLAVQAGEYSAVVCGEEVQLAQNRPLTKEDAAKQIKKTGNSLFIFDDLTVEIDSDIFLPVKKLNELRRNALEALKLEILREKLRNTEPEMVKNSDNMSPSGDNAIEGTENHIASKSVWNVDKTYLQDRNNTRIHVSVMDKKQLESAFLFAKQIQRIYIPADLLYQKKVTIENVVEYKKDYAIEIYLSLPRIIRKRDDKYLEIISEYWHYFDGILVKNIEELSFLKIMGYDGHIITDSMIYNWNKQALAFLNQYRNEFCYPLELSIYENCSLENYHGEYIVYGRTPMMVSANCIRKTTDSCNKNVNAFEQTLTDRYRKMLPVYTNCVHCYNEVFNAVSMSLHKELQQILKKGFYKFRLDFTNESGTQVEQIIKYYINIMGNSAWKAEFPLQEYTLGHFKEGAL